ncbi:MAG: GPW/gp25 family protein [Anaerolineae bacterium]|nr:GPW/gp25 family protein [Anaerolineae bacterium]
MPQDFFGVGWNFPVQADGEHQIALAKYEDSIRQSIQIILSTAPGERVMRPDFGSGLHELVFSVADAETRSRVIAQVREALVRWEPRIDVLDVTVENDPQQPTHLLILIHYRVRANNSRFNLVYPFYMER